MHDQASELRKLVLRSGRSGAQGGHPRPKLVAVCGGKGGMGVTTIAVQSALSLTRQGVRTVLIDAHLTRSNVAAQCQLQPHARSVADVLSARCGIHEVLQSGPAGLQVAPGDWAPREAIRWSDRSRQRLLDEIGSLGQHAETALLDLGQLLPETTGQLAKQCDTVLLVTQGDDVAVMDCYAAVKTSLDSPGAPRLAVVVNRTTEEKGEDVYRRLEQSCRRFLGLTLEYWGTIPNSTASSWAETADENNAKEAMEQLAGRMAELDAPVRKAAA